MSKEIVVTIGAGGIGLAIARRQGTGRTVLLADLNEQLLASSAAALEGSGHAVASRRVDISSRESVKVLADAAAEMGEIVNVIVAAGVSPVQATKDKALARTPAEKLASLEMLSDQAIPNSGAAYALAKRANALRVQAAAVEWGDRGARVNTISPGIVITPLARDEMSGPGAEGYRRMIEICAAHRAGTTDEIATAAAFMLGPDGGFITGSDLLVDGGVIAAIHAGRIQVGI